MNKVVNFKNVTKELACYVASLSNDATLHLALALAFWGKSEMSDTADVSITEQQVVDIYWMMAQQPEGVCSAANEQLTDLLIPILEQEGRELLKAEVMRITALLLENYRGSVEKGALRIAALTQVMTPVGV